MDNDLNKQLIDYYKWVSSIAVFTLSTSIALTNLVEPNIQHRGLLVLGWGLLALAIWANGILIKSLVSHSVVMAQPESAHTKLHAKFLDGWQHRAQALGAVQQTALTVGALLVAGVFVLRIFGR